MGYTAIIAEKPSVAKSIAKVVGADVRRNTDGPCGWTEGNGYKVTWAFGHLVGLMSPAEMGFGAEDLPMVPGEWKTKVVTKTVGGKTVEDSMARKQLKNIRALFSGADSIIVATDAGREGELIFRYIYEFLGCTTPFKRLWISSLTDEAIRKGLSELKDGSCYENLSRAAHQRSRADWLVGLNASKALTLFTQSRRLLSLGRVQTPTLGMICQRYEDNRNFVPTPYWQVCAESDRDGTPLAVLTEKKYKEEAAAETDLEKVRADGRLRMSAVEKKSVTARPPLLYDLTALQRVANSRYGFTAEETLKTAQSLYEKKVTTYPRTGSRYIPDDVFRTVPSLLKKIAGMDILEDLRPHALALEGKTLCRKSVDASKVTDHHALLPTGVEPHELSPAEAKVYSLICSRMVEAFGGDSVSEVTTVTLVSAGVVFKAKGSVLTVPGWKAVSGGETAEEKREEGDEPEKTRLPKLAEGDVLPVRKAETVRKTDKPLPIYTDSSLLGEMETCGRRIEDEQTREAMKEVGLGTPATRAETIEKLIRRGYVVRDKKKLIPTEAGLQVWSMVKGKKIADVETTGRWERDLAMVERGEKDADEFERGICELVVEVVDDLRDAGHPLSGGNSPQRFCPLCGKPLKGQKYSFTCDGEEGGCGLKIPRSLCGKTLPDSALDKLCKGETTALLKGFVSKSGKKFEARLALDREGRKVVFVFPEAEAVDTSGLRCPKCSGALSDDSKAVSCSCGFKLWKTQLGASLSSDQVKSLLKGEKVYVTKMRSKAGKTFDAYVRLDPATWNTALEFPRK